MPRELGEICYFINIYEICELSKLKKNLYVYRAQAPKIEVQLMRYLMI